MHEVALHSSTATDQLRPPFNTDALKQGVVGSTEALSSAHISAISACLNSVDGLFTTFLSMDIPEIRTLPVFTFVRVAYGVVILVKMYFTAASKGSELGKVIDKDNLRVEYYLDALTEKFRQASAGNRCRPASKFVIVLAMLKAWFVKQKSLDPTIEPSRQAVNNTPGSQTYTQAQTARAGSVISDTTPYPQQSPQTGNPSTPLHLLSEVATGSDAARRARASFTAVVGLPQPQQPYFHETTTPSPTPSRQQQGQPPQQRQQETQQLPPFSTVPSGPWIPSPTLPQQPQQQRQSLQQAQPPGSLDLNLAGITGMNFDIANMGVNLEAADGMSHNILSDPWFNDIFEGFQTMPDANAFFPL